MNGPVSYGVILTMLFTALIRTEESGRGISAYHLLLCAGYAVGMIVPLAVGGNAVLLVLMVLVLILINLLFLMRSSRPYLIRSILLAFNMATLFMVLGHARRFAGFAPWFGRLVRNLASANSVLTAVSPQEILAFLFGLAGVLFVTVGLNEPIALILKTTGLMPGTDDGSSQADRKEPARGRAIGYLERGIILMLMLSGNVGGVGFVLAVKGFARFKQLDDRSFGEYFLIGTLMSAGLTMAVGFLMRAWF